MKWSTACETRPYYELFEAIMHKDVAKEGKKIKDYIKNASRAPYQMTFLYVNWQDYPLFDFRLVLSSFQTLEPSFLTAFLLCNDVQPSSEYIFIWN